VEIDYEKFNICMFTLDSQCLFLLGDTKVLTFCSGFINFTRDGHLWACADQNPISTCWISPLLAHSCTADFSPFCVLINSTVCNPPLITSLWIWRCQELFSFSVSEVIFAVAKGDIVSELFLNIEISSAEEHLHSSLIS